MIGRAEEIDITGTAADGKSETTDPRGVNDMIVMVVPSGPNNRNDPTSPNEQIVPKETIVRREMIIPSKQKDLIVRDTTVRNETTGTRGVTATIGILEETGTIDTRELTEMTAGISRNRHRRLNKMTLQSARTMANATIIPSSAMGNRRQLNDTNGPRIMSAKNSR